MYKYDRSVPGVVISHREPGMGERLAGFFKIRTGTSTFSGHRRLKRKCNKKSPHNFHIRFAKDSVKNCAGLLF